MNSPCVAPAHIGAVPAGHGYRPAAGVGAPTAFVTEAGDDTHAAADDLDWHLDVPDPADPGPGPAESHPTLGSPGVL